MGYFWRGMAVMALGDEFRVLDQDIVPVYELRKLEGLFYVTDFLFITLSCYDDHVQEHQRCCERFWSVAFWFKCIPMWMSIGQAILATQPWSSAPFAAILQFSAYTPDFYSIFHLSVWFIAIDLTIMWALVRLASSSCSYTGDPYDYYGLPCSMHVSFGQRCCSLFELATTVQYWVTGSIARNVNLISAPIFTTSLQTNPLRFLRLATLARVCTHSETLTESTEFPRTSTYMTFLSFSIL